VLGLSLIHCFCSLINDIRICEFIWVFLLIRLDMLLQGIVQRGLQRTCGLLLYS